MRRILRQGQADGLCGLYALLHFLNETDWAEEPRTGLRYLLHAVRQIGELTPENLTDGFEDHHLRAILQLQISNYRLPFQVTYLSDAYAQYERFGSTDLFRKICDQGGAIIAGLGARAHWVLIKQGDNGPEIWDSDEPENPVLPLSKRRFLRDEDGGIVITPIAREIESITLDAQSN